MHFWIDKRSQQCGFGRSRGVASFSGANGGVGFGFGHPPRRSNANKSTSSSGNSNSIVPGIHRHPQQQQQQLLQQQHNHHQHHHQQPHYHHHHQQQQQAHPQYLQHQQQQQQRQSNALIVTTADCHATRSVHGVSNNNSDCGYHRAPIQHQLCPIVGPSPSQSQYEQCQDTQLQTQFAAQSETQPNASGHEIALGLNNNSHQCQLPTQEQFSLGQATATNAINNNNGIPSMTVHMAATGSACAAILTDAGTIVPVTSSNSMSGRGMRHNSRAVLQHQHQYQNCTVVPAKVVGSSVPSQSHCHQYDEHCDMRNFHHPQFGNMSVRHCPTTLCHPSRAHAHPNQLPHESNMHHQQQTVSALTSGNGNIVATSLTCHNAINDHMRSQFVPRINQNTQIYRQSSSGPNVYRSSLRSNANMRVSNNAAACNLNVLESDHVGVGMGVGVHQQHAIQESGDAQLLPAHLKCGMCASLILASVFVAGVKFYFDHQGTGIEILIFCAFSATFFLAACTVSLCRIPKGFMPMRTARNLIEDHGRTVYVSGNVVGASLNGGIGDNHITTGILTSSNVNDSIPEQERTRVITAQAGPPPYHIAILLPENNKEVTMDESPPPSYDKILI